MGFRRLRRNHPPPPPPPPPSSGCRSRSIPCSPPHSILLLRRRLGLSTSPPGMPPHPASTCGTPAPAASTASPYVSILLPPSSAMPPPRLRLFALASDLEQPEQEYYLRPVKPGKCHPSTVVFPVAFSVGVQHLWDRYMLAVPFEEDEKDPSIWFVDHNYHEAMFGMFKRINAKEHVVGWYSTGPELRENDLDIHALFTGYVPNLVLVIIDVQPKELGIPTKAFYAVEEVKENVTRKSRKVFVHVPSEIAAHEVEEISAEHLLRDVKDTTISTLATEVTGKLAALKGLVARLREIRDYLDFVVDGKLPLNHEILYHLQAITQGGNTLSTRKSFFPSAERDNIVQSSAHCIVGLVD